MSAGAFEKGKYESNSGDIYAIRAQPESKALTIDGTANDYPTADVDQKVRARVSGTHRGYGVHARFAYVRFTGTLPTGYKAGTILKVPVFKKAMFDGFLPDQTGTYLGQAVELVGWTTEKIK